MSQAKVVNSQKFFEYMAKKAKTSTISIRAFTGTHPSRGEYTQLFFENGRGTDIATCGNYSDGKTPDYYFVGKLWS